jgi:hypothetical protein
VAKRFGVDTLKEISAIQHLRWILPPDDEKHKATLIFFNFMVTTIETIGGGVDLLRVMSKMQQLRITRVLLPEVKVDFVYL